MEYVIMMSKITIPIEKEDKDALKRLVSWGNGTHFFPRIMKALVEALRQDKSLVYKEHITIKGESKDDRR